MFAIYRDHEIAARYFNGAGYVVRHEMYPHTHFSADGPVTRQGHAMLTGIRQGIGVDGGFTYRRYRLPDSEPGYLPEARPWCGTCPRCGRHGVDADHVSWCDWQPN